MIPNPIHKVLSSIRANGVQSLLMGGQACVLYGAAEFSRDIDFAILADPKNLSRLRTALDVLQAEVIAVPPFKPQYLRRGHAIHFRCRHPETEGLRIDVMSKMRGVARFSILWGRRTTITLREGIDCDLISLPDLVQCKKTQRDKDWPMLRRLLETHYFEYRAEADPPLVRFWLRELRTPELLIELCKEFPILARRESDRRQLLRLAIAQNGSGLHAALEREEKQEREKDRRYWEPLRTELERLRHLRVRGKL